MSQRIGIKSLEYCKSDFDSSLKYLHALILTGSTVTHFQRDQNGKWNKQNDLSTACTQPAAICSQWKIDGSTPTYMGSRATIVEGSNAVDYSRTTGASAFTRGRVISSNCTGLPSLMSWAPAGFNGHSTEQADNIFNYILEGNTIVEYYNNGLLNSSVGWERYSTISTQATGPAAVFQSGFRASTTYDYNLEALVQEGNNIVHYWMDSSLNPRHWQRGVTVSTSATGPACLIGSAIHTMSSAPGDLEALIPEGRNLVNYARNNSAPGLPWSRGAVVATDSDGPGCMVLGEWGDFNIEALVQENGSIFHHWRNNAAAGDPWAKDVLIA